MWNRRQFLVRGAGAGASTLLFSAGCARPTPPGILLNDRHSGLNETRVASIAQPRSVEELAAVVREAGSRDASISVAGGRHAMGGQQFGEDTVHVDTTALVRVAELDRDAGEVEVGAGIQWPELHRHLVQAQSGEESPWGIRQKQSGADRLCLGGALAANIHSRSLTMPPIVEDVAAFTLLGPDGETRRCSRTENPELFRLAIGGYGLFGVITSVRLRLARRQRVERHVEIIDVRDLMEKFQRRIENGYRFGDFQYSTDYESAAGLRQGVLSCYRPVEDRTPVTDNWKRLGRSDWLELVRLAHTDRARAFETFSAYYLSTHGQIYWSDSHQLSTYVDDYHSILGRRLGRYAGGSEMITELHVPRDRFAEFLRNVRTDFRRSRPNLIYGTVRLIEPESETMLAWARQPWVCVIFNLHVSPERGAMGKAGDDFRALIDRALELDGGYFLTYHRWATREQVLAAYPVLPEFLRQKRVHDPDERFQSDWYRHYRTMFTETS